MTIQELYELIKQKKESAINDLMREQAKLIIGKPVETEFLSALRGEIDAYTDVLILIESSGVLDGK